MAETIFQIGECSTDAHLQRALASDCQLVREHAAEEIDRRKTKAEFDRRLKERLATPAVFPETPTQEGQVRRKPGRKPQS